jgi:hypothetical protein
MQIVIIIRRDAYAAVKEGVDSLNEENERLVEDLESRWV